ncbi:MAG: CbiX/SirB N-terminal domain-containing protein, partial [Gallionella sp.]|nr:CbiX/SirB N-terminal domain-containing protein [Gallionella sp.]
MNKTVLLVGHGSRQNDGNEEILRFAEIWRARHEDTNVEVCFIEHGKVLMSEGLDKAAARG